MTLSETTAKGDIATARERSPAPRALVDPPRWVALAVYAGLAALLYYPVHVRYQNPDQDFPGVALYELVRGGIEPITIYYPSALMNLLRAGYELLLVGARLLGRPLDALDLVAAFARDPAPFRIAPRLVAMTGGVLSLVAVTRLTAVVADRWAGLFAAVLLGTSYMFVREHHHGMYDAPAATAVILSLWACGCYVRRPSGLAFAGAAAAAALALSFKYNTVVVFAAPLLALVLAPVPAWERVRILLVGTLAVIVALLFTSPFMVLEPSRLLQHLVDTFDFFQRFGRQVSRRGGPPYGFGDVLQNGLGIPLVLTAVVGIGAALYRRERALVPLVFFTAVYAWIVWRSPMPLNRYALPLAAPVAVLAAYALHRVPAWPRRIGLVALVLLGLPTCLSYVTLLAREDTRVASLRWLQEHVRPDADVYLPGSVMTALYIGPDVGRPLTVVAAMPEDVVAPLRERIGATFPARRLYFAPGAAWDTRPAGPQRFAPWSNAVVVTSEFPDAPFAEHGTNKIVLRDLEQYAQLLADFPVERTPAGRVYEPDLNYVPMRGLRTLSRPGPRIRIWYVPKLVPTTVPSPLLDGSPPH